MPEQSERNGYKNEVVGFLNNKGGVGKTGSITTLAHMIATEYEKKYWL